MYYVLLFILYIFVNNSYLNVKIMVVFNFSEEVTV